MAVKLIMTWDINPEHEREYFEFVVGEFIPGVQRLGLQPAEAWVTMYGEYPQIQVGILAESQEAAHVLLGSKAWSALSEKLFAFVSNYTMKMVPAKAGFQF
ncbi:MAG: hypothetical protein JXB85_06775 [Anaerolineales bacterium]|nr:hypothetical protein [Anaerolineales bacterium]